jgi:hypothetical protein
VVDAGTKETDRGMVFYYKARPDAGDYTIYMGADKNENEELIKYGLPEDVWYEHFPFPPSSFSI